MREEVYQEIFEAVFPFLPDDWQRLIIREVFASEGNEVKFFVQDSSLQFHDPFSLGLNAETVFSISKTIHDSLIQMRPQQGKERWNSITIVIDNEGNFNTSFGYDDCQFDEAFESRWASQYLKQ